MKVMQSKKELFRDNVDLNEALHLCMSKNIEFTMVHESTSAKIAEANLQLTAYDNSIAYLNREIRIAEAKNLMWRKVATNRDELINRDKNEEQAIALASYYEGMADAFIQTKNQIKADLE